MIVKEKEAVILIQSDGLPPTASLARNDLSEAPNTVQPTGMNSEQQVTPAKSSNAINAIEPRNPKVNDSKPKESGKISSKSKSMKSVQQPSTKLNADTTPVAGKRDEAVLEEVSSRGSGNKNAFRKKTPSAEGDALDGRRIRRKERTTDKPVPDGFNVDNEVPNISLQSQQILNSSVEKEK